MWTQLFSPDYLQVSLCNGDNSSTCLCTGCCGDHKLVCGLWYSNLDSMGQIRKVSFSGFLISYSLRAWVGLFFLHPPDPTNPTEHLVDVSSPVIYARPGEVTEVLTPTVTLGSSDVGLRRFLQQEVRCLQASSSSQAQWPLGRGRPLVIWGDGGPMFTPTCSSL